MGLSNISLQMLHMNCTNCIGGGDGSNLGTSRGQLFLAILRMSAVDPVDGAFWGPTLVFSLLGWPASFGL